MPPSSPPPVSVVPAPNENPKPEAESGGLVQSFKTHPDGSLTYCEHTLDAEPGADYPETPVDSYEEAMKACVRGYAKYQAAGQDKLMTADAHFNEGYDSAKEERY